MKNIWQILTFLLAGALCFMLVTDLRGDTAQEPQRDLNKSRESVGLDIIMTRSSVRSYTSQPVEPSKVETILKAGMAAPTAGNRQPWEMVVVNERETLDSFAKIVPGAHMAAKAQCAIVVCGTPAKALVPEYWIQDCSAVTENILLAAHSMGLGAVWCGAFPNNTEDKVGQLSKLLAIPDGTYALSIIVLGYPDKDPKIKDKWDPTKVHYGKF